MRLLSSISCAVITLGMIYLDNPAPLDRFFVRRSEELETILYQKNVQFKNLSLVRDSELSPLLPQDKSVPWWLFNKQEVETQLLRHSLVRKATVRTCDRLAITNWGCFAIDIEERQPAFAALIEDEVWILGQDGGLLFPVSHREFEQESLKKILSKHLARDMSADVRLKILQVAGKSPDLIHARLSYTRKALEIIEQESKLEVAMARCSKHGEIRANFEGYPFEVIFDYAENSPDTLATEATRLAALVAEFGQRAQAIKLIDLAYNKLAVVRFNDSEQKAREGIESGKTMFTTKGSRSRLVKGVGVVPRPNDRR